MTDLETKRPEPIMDDHSREWFEAAERGELLIQRSPSTGKAYFYPRKLTPGALNEELVWDAAEGTGEVYTYTVVYRNANPEFAEDCPYVLAIVRLTEGVHVTTRIVGVDPEEIFCGMPVQVKFEKLGETMLPMFAPAEAKG